MTLFEYLLENVEGIVAIGLTVATAIAGGKALKKNVGSVHNMEDAVRILERTNAAFKQEIERLTGEVGTLKREVERLSKKETENGKEIAELKAENLELMREKMQKPQGQTWSGHGGAAPKK